MAQRSLLAVTKVYYGLYAKFCQDSTQYHSIAKVSWGSRGTTAPLAPCEPGGVTTPNSHSSDQGTLPTTSLTSRQAVPYWTHGSTCCFGYLLLWLSPYQISARQTTSPDEFEPSPPFQTLLKPQHQTSPRSNHISTDWRPNTLTKTQAKLNII
jgi:hypothetical protein